MLKFDLPISPPSKIQGLVAGSLSDGGGEEIPIIYPATGEQISTLIEDDEKSVDKAVSAARAAAIFIVARATGAFQGATSAATPTGIRFTVVMKALA